MTGKQRFFTILGMIVGAFLLVMSFSVYFPEKNYAYAFGCLGAGLVLIALMIFIQYRLREKYGKDTVIGWIIEKVKDRKEEKRREEVRRAAEERSAARQAEERAKAEEVARLREKAKAEAERKILEAKLREAEARASAAEARASEAEARPTRVPASFSISFDGTDGKKLTKYPSDYCCIDVETTGLDSTKDRITEVAAVKVRGGKIVDRFSSLVQPDIPIPPYIEKKTGITNDMVSKAPVEKEVIPSFLKFVGYGDVVGYNVVFDMRFIEAAADRCNEVFCSDYYDVMPLAKKCLPGLDGYSLEKVSSHLNISVEKFHRALADAETTILCASALRAMSSPEEKKRVEYEQYDFSRITVNYDAIKPSVDAIDPCNPLYKKRVVFTGELTSMTRSEACQYVVDHGGETSDKVTKGTAFLVIGEAGFAPNTGEGGSIKMRKADEWRAKGSSIINISETDFFAMMNDYEKSKEQKNT